MPDAGCRMQGIQLPNRSAFKLKNLFEARDSNKIIGVLHRNETSPCNL